MNQTRATPALPPGFRLTLDDSVRRFDHGSAEQGTVLLGGSPLRLLRLANHGPRQLDAWLAGAAVGDKPGEGTLARRLVDAGVLHPRPGPAALGADAVTLVVPVKDNPAGLEQLLDVTGGLAARVVVDDASREPLVHATVRHPHPAGPAAARNTGWRRASTELVAFLDSDTIPEPGWLRSLLPHFNDPAVAAVAPRVRGNPATTGAIGRYETARSALDMGDRPAAVQSMSRVSYVPTAALVVRRSALHEVSGFDDQLRFGEDVDLVWRLIDHGMTVRYEPEATVWHEPRVSLRSWLRQRFDYGTSAAALAARHPGRLSPARVSRWSAAAWLLVILGHPLAGAALATGSASLLPRKLHDRGVPAPQALALAGRGHLAAGRALADATRRTWWPLALLTRRGRLTLLASAAAGLLATRQHNRHARTAALRIADDLAYGAGVWAGCIRHRSLAPLLPTLSEWPGRSR